MCYFVDFLFPVINAQANSRHHSGTPMHTLTDVMLRKSPDRAHGNFLFSAFWVFNKMEILSKIIFFSFKEFERVTVVIKISENI